MVAGGQDGHLRSPGEVALAEEATAEQGLPCLIGEHTHIDAMDRVGTGVGLDIEQFGLAGEVGEGLMPQEVELPGIDRLVDRAPVDGARDGGIFHQEAVLGLPAGVGAGADREGPPGGQQALAAADGMFDQFGHMVRDMQLAGRLHPAGQRL
jgi:hypothetical protein